MKPDFWQRQEPDKPLFPDLIWNRPETRQFAGKLLVVGGNAHDFQAPAAAYGEAGKGGIGIARVLLPDALSRTLSAVIPEAEFVSSTPSGSFAQNALAELLDASAWADGVLLAGSYGKNAETAVLLEAYVQKYSGVLTLAGDSADFFFTNPAILFARQQTTLVLEFSQLQKLAQENRFRAPFTSGMDLLHFLQALHGLTLDTTAAIITIFNGNTVVAANGQLSTTKVPFNATKTAAHASVWNLQNPSQPFQALTTAVL